MADALVELLNSYGYQPVFLPRTGIAPPELYHFAEHRLVRLGPLAKVLPAGAPPLTVRRGKLGDIDGQVTSGKDLGAAAGFLKSALAVLGIPSLPRLDLSFAGSKSFVFAFTGVTYEAVDPIDLAGVLQGLTLPLAIPDAYVATGALHVAYEYASATSLTMRRADGKRFSADVEGDVGEWVDVGAKAKVEVTSGAQVSFAAAGGVPAAFAYKAGRLEREGDRWTFEPEVVKQARAAGRPPKARPYLPGPSVVLAAEDAEGL